MAVGLLCIVVFGSLVAVRAPMWDAVDEGAHFAYIQQIAEHGSLPVLDKTYVSEQVLALGAHVYPAHTDINPKNIGLAGYSYEAFQPPLYYALAVPVYYLSGNFHTKVVLIRFFDLALLLVTIVLFARLCRVLLSSRWWIGLAAGMVVFALPSVLVRNVLISNLPLEMLLVTACVSELVLALVRDAPRRLFGAGVLMGLAILTDLFGIELIPVFVAVTAALLWRARSWQRLTWGAAGGVVGGALVVPWLVFNEDHYHALTAGAIAKRMQQPIVNPDHVHYGLRMVLDLTFTGTFSPVVPQEWSVSSGSFWSWAASVLGVFLIPVALFIAVVAVRSLMQMTWPLVLVWMANLGVCWWISLDQQWLTLLPRYTYPTLPLLVLAMAVGALELLKTARPFLLALAGSMVLVMVMWIQLQPQIHRL